MMDRPVFEIHLKTVVIFLKQIRSPAKGAHDRLHFNPPIYIPLFAPA